MVRFSLLQPDVGLEELGKTLYQIEYTETRSGNGSESDPSVCVRYSGGANTIQVCWFFSMKVYVPKGQKAAWTAIMLMWYMNL